MKSNIALIGFMGAGKTAVGKVLAEQLDKEFIELDALIEQKAGKAISDIFREHGEIYFRELEIAAVKEVAHRQNTIIACGGGAALNKINIDRLSEQGTVVYLVAKPDAILRRTSGDKTKRPLLESKDKLAQIKEMLEYRKPYYERAADIRINTSSHSIEEVANQIIKRLTKNESDSDKK
ncbi:MAG: shikimate kinase [Dehalococcoidales bacterium]|nr:shikimate kinase [Dehalococcoidales bacterium]